MSDIIEGAAVDLEGGIDNPATKIDCFGIERSQADIDARNKCWLDCLVVLIMFIGGVIIMTILIGFIVFPIIAGLTKDKTTQIVLASISGVYAFAVLCALLYGIYLCGRKYVFFV